MKKIPSPSSKRLKNLSGKVYSVKDLLNLMARLRGPKGCPWDREQTPHTLKKFLIEETYEVIEAIEAGTPAELREELGDLLLQILLQSQIAAERGDFKFSDVVQTLGEKLVRRHPHVFASSPRAGRQCHPRTPRDVLQIWGKSKAAEGKYANRVSLLDGLPLSLPALERAQRISQRVSRVGFDWTNLEDLYQKVLEEMDELRRAEKKHSRKEMEEEIGDLFFTLVNWARFQGISAEEALRKTNRRFARRFARLERELERRGRTLAESNLQEMNRIWEKVKKRERK